MTEAEWLACEDPEQLYAEIAGTVFCARWPHSGRTARKRVFFCVACCRLVWPWVAVDDRCRRGVEYYESMFDNPDPLDVEELILEVKDAARHPDDGTPIPQQLAAQLVYDIGDPQAAIGWIVRAFEEWLTHVERSLLVANLMREIVGNPFRPMTADSSWLTSTAVTLARQMYESRDFSAMPILADALQDAGCDNEDILNHCRQPGEHMRGCWVVDLVLGKE